MIQIICLVAVGYMFGPMAVCLSLGIYIGCMLILACVGD